METVLYRRRLIPDECVELKDDRIIYKDEDKLITAWNTLKPRSDFTHGFSCYFLNRGLKVSCFLKDGDVLHKWYVDVVKYEKENLPDSLIIVDLLLDMIINPDGSMDILDVDELYQAREMGIIDFEDYATSLEILGGLIAKVKAHEFDTLKAPILEHCGANISLQI